MENLEQGESLIIPQFDQYLYLHMFHQFINKHYFKNSKSGEYCVDITSSNSKQAITMSLSFVDIEREVEGSSRHKDFE
jgi:hypothetical protein